MIDAATFRVLLDGPAEDPALGFPAYARAFADIISHSPPQFAIGVFGDWGSGKTTLMRAIERDLTTPDPTAGPRPDVVTVWFNAWRYEREPHLIVPMLDTLREALVEWAAKQPAATAGQSSARAAATKIGRAARALLAGFSLTARLPLPLADIEASFDPQKVMGRLGGDDELADHASSFYHASFNEMKAAMDDFAEKGARRVVVFIDDLDRCLPLSALEVLESMKLFFDLEGFVFVAGLDQTIIERAIELKYAPGGPEASAPKGLEAGDQAGGGRANRVAATRTAPISGRDYVKKIFQVPFGLPRIPTAEIDIFFDDLLRKAGLGDDQLANFNQVVRPHLQHLTGDQPVNPRDVKRLLNAYTLQLKMLSAKQLPGGVRPEVVIALQTISFRPDWQRLYDQLAADPAFFKETLSSAVAETDMTQDFWLRNEPIPQALLRYVRGPARPLLEVELEPYVSSAEITRSTFPGLLSAQGAVAQMLRQVDELDAMPGSEMISSLTSQLERINIELPTSSSAGGPGVGALVERARNVVMSAGGPQPTGADVTTWKTEMHDVLARIDDNLRELRRETSLGPQAS